MCALLLSLVGGIYTVIRSKAGVTVEELGDQYILLGPYSEATVQTEVELMEPENPKIKSVLRSMTDKGIKASIYTPRAKSGAGYKDMHVTVCCWGWFKSR